jgi:hypothetical protein
MATRHFESASLGIHPDSLFLSTRLMSGFAAPLSWVQVQQANVQFREDGWPASTQVEVNNIGQCIRWASAIEGGIALLIYAGWVVWHLWM